MDKAADACHLTADTTAEIRKLKVNEEVKAKGGETECTRTDKMPASKDHTKVQQR